MDLARKFILLCNLFVDVTVSTVFEIRMPKKLGLLWN